MKKCLLEISNLLIHMAKVWSKRFDNSLNPFIEKFNASIGFDKKLILEDLDCSIAHAKMLGKTQVFFF